ncbi:MAG: NPCBM/NEW2 domain-containing protein [Candidatus Saccharicenans sp.]|jgi:alpha-galactosidase|nr:NPCBM/NEW2 domain-containing protein [Candidatus Saccharicenans sp.]MDH7574232.1 NPCBM/NEW2 domain-containing protein [Candidatus Saccharicenans sp.]
MNQLLDHRNQSRILIGILFLLFGFSFLLLTYGCSQKPAGLVYLDELGAQQVTAGWSESKANKSIDGNPLTVAGQLYERGLGTHAESQYRLNLDGRALNFQALVGVDDEVKKTQRGAERASVEFIVSARDKNNNKKVLWKSGLMKAGEPAREVKVSLKGFVSLDLVVTDAGDGIGYDHADWCQARIEYAGKRPEPVKPYAAAPYILTPATGPEPRINGPRVFGVRPGSPFLFTIPATGQRPMTFAAEGLPSGLRLDTNTGHITGAIDKPGTYNVKLIARNSLGTAERELRIEVGDKICLTPPMGWNSWNCWACSVTDENVRQSARAMVEKGLINYGWTYINIDDCWHGQRDPKTGEIRSNEKFPDMKALADYVHGLGLKIGLYTDCGPKTCAGYEGSEGHEEQDIMTYAKWGFDYVKIDWCYCEGKDPRVAYKKFGEAISRAPRDIVFSICNWGVEKPWEWGESVGGNLWRTTGDITDTWASMAGIGFGQAGLAKYAGPGHWNDPDMLVVGKVGWGPELRPSRLTPDEQYTHISLWCLLAAPLLIGCPIEQLDDFTLGLLTNTEVLEVDQDPLGRQADRVFDGDDYQVWARQLEDGSRAVGLFNLDAYEFRKVRIDFAAMGLGAGSYRVRDLWRQKDLGVFSGGFETEVPPHGVALVRLWKK